MNQLERECQSVVDALDDVLLCGVVDHGKRCVLAARGEAPVTPEIEKALLEATLELLERCGPESKRSSAATPGYGEMQLTDARTRYFAKMLHDGARIAVLVTHKDANAGLGWAQLRAMVTELQQSE